jgi:3-dehydroquinate synthase
MASVLRICRTVQDLGLDRKGILLALGGGVCSDVVTVAATLVRRGLQHVRVPTTLLAQVDAGIGVKGGVNFGGHKNYLGSFNPPTTVLIDTTFLRTLSRRRIREGLSEILKMALVADRALFEVLQHSGPPLVETRFQDPPVLARQIVERSIHLMLKELSKNPYEDRSKERVVDMGHTFSPALETASGFRLTHGEAVAIDMAFTCVIAELVGSMPAADSEAFLSLLAALRLPVSSRLLTLELCKEALTNAIAHRGGRLNMVTPLGIGKAMFLGIEALSDSLLKSAMQRLRKRVPLASSARRARVVARVEDCSSGHYGT